MNYSEKKFSYVASIDYLKQEHIRDQLTEEFDIIVIDEAHKMKLRTSRLILGKHLASKTNVLILLTATPHDGRDEDFMARIVLLDRFATNVQTSSYLWIRTIKEDVVDLEGKAVFPDRVSHTINIQLFNKEREILDLLEDYFRLIQSHAHTPQEQKHDKISSAHLQKEGKFFVSCITHLNET